MTLKATTARATRVLVVAESAERQRLLRAKLAEEEALEPGDMSGADLGSALRQARAGVMVVADLDLDEDQRETASRIAEVGAGVVLLTDNAEGAWVAQLLASGARSVLRRDCSGRQLAAAVQAVAAGLTALEPEMVQALLRPPLDTIELEPGEEELTPRETEVLRMMTAGLSNREIASALGISEHTVKFHITSIFGKLGTSSRTEAVTEGIRRGLVLL
jgi:two-component system, NarL family, response regulator YdfI